MIFEIREIKDKAGMLQQFPLLKQLNRNLEPAALNRMLDDMLAHGYRMCGVFEKDLCVGLSGYWISTKIYCDKYLEMDNVVIGEAYRSQGLGKLLCDHLHQVAAAHGCRMLMLDAYLENEAAHRFYEREGFTRRGFHFIKNVSDH